MRREATEHRRAQRAKRVARCGGKVTVRLVRPSADEVINAVEPYDARKN
jgi:hypothetical protein